MASEQLSNGPSTTLNGAIGSGDTTLVVTSASGFPTVPQFRLQIDSELLLVTGVSGTTFTVTRGIEGTTPASHSNGATVTAVLTAGSLQEVFINPVTCGGRLTLTSGVAVTTGDLSGGTLYFTPFVGNRVALYDGTRWKLYAFSELSLSLTLTSGNVYDVFLYDNSGTLTLETLVWTSGTARATALVLQDGVNCKSGALTRRYLGTIRASGSNTTEDSEVKRFVWNAENRFPRTLRVTDSTNDWRYDSATFRQARASSSNQVEIVTGLTSFLSLELSTLVYSPALGTAACAIGEDSTSAAATECMGMSFIIPAGGGIPGTAFLRKYPSIGYHYYAWLEYGSGSECHWRGDDGTPSRCKEGISGYILG